MSLEPGHRAGLFAFPGVLVRTDGITWSAHAKVDKWTAEQVAEVAAATGTPNPSGDLLARYFAPDVTEAPGNLLTTAGLTRLTDLATTGSGFQHMNNNATRLGVGDGSTAAAIGDTDLSAAAGSTHRYFMTMDATYPQNSAGVITFKATFGSSDGNFTWSEWCIDIGTPTVTAGTTVNACMMNRKVASLGTKASGSVWAFTATITLS